MCCERPRTCLSISCYATKLHSRILLRRSRFNGASQLAGIQSRVRSRNSVWREASRKPQLVSAAELQMGVRLCSNFTGTLPGGVEKQKVKPRGEVGFPDVQWFLCGTNNTALV